MKVTPIDQLNEKELIMLFATSFDSGTSSFYRTAENRVKWLNRDVETRKALQEKGYISIDELFDWTVEGKQYTDKYRWDISELILQFSRDTQNTNVIYEKVKAVKNLPEVVFYNILNDLIDSSLIPNILIGYCGSDCTKCDVFIATIQNNDNLRESHASKLTKEWKEWNVKLTRDNINCLACRSSIAFKIGEQGCNWKKCCINRGFESCGYCEGFPCVQLKDMLDHMPEFEKNLIKVYVEDKKGV